MRGPRTAMKSGPHLLQLEKALAQKRRPNTAINKQTNKHQKVKKKKKTTAAHSPIKKKKKSQCLRVKGLSVYLKKKTKNSCVHQRRDIVFLGVVTKKLGNFVGILVYSQDSCWLQLLDHQAVFTLFCKSVHFNIGKIPDSVE